MSVDLNSLTIKGNDSKVRDAFYASDYKKPAFDIYQSFMGTPKTNPMQWFETLKFGAGNGVEAQMLKILKDSGIVAEDYDQNVQGKISFEYEGVPIHGRIDAITTSGIPIEIKSVNNKNKWDISAYQDGHPRDNYVGQLAIYMHALDVDTGYLFVASVDGLSRFLFECTRKGTKYKCANVEIDIADEFNRWKTIYNEHVIPKVEVSPLEYIYKYDVDEIDWSKVSNDKISKARNNQAVVGDFQVLYSSYKDLWIEKQGSTLGYSAEELIKIREKTQGYTTWR